MGVTHFGSSRKKEHNPNAITERENGREVQSIEYQCKYVVVIKIFVLRLSLILIGNDVVVSVLLNRDYRI